MRPSIYMIFSLLFVILFDSCNSDTGSALGFSSDIVIEPLKLDDDFTLEVLMSRVEKREKKMEKFEEMLSEQRDEINKRTASLAKNDSDKYRKAEVIRFDKIFPNQLSNYKRSDVFECVNNKNNFSNNIKNNDDYCSVYGLFYLSKCYYCSDPTEICKVPNRYPELVRLNYEDSQVDDSNTSLLFTLREAGLFTIGKYGSPAENNGLYKQALLIGKAELSRPQEGVFIEELTINLPNAVQIYQNIKAKNVISVLGSDYATGIPDRYYSLFILINSRINIFVQTPYAVRKDPKKFSEAVEFCKKFKESLNYKDLVNLSKI